MEKKEYFIAENEMQKGPFSLEQLGEQGIERTTRVFCRGFAGFVNAEEVKEIREYYFSGKRPKPAVSPVPEEPVAPVGPTDMDAVRDAARRERMMREQLEKQKREAAEAARKVQEIPGVVPPPSFGPAVVEEVVETKEWHLRNGGDQVGPLTLSELKGCTLTPQSIVWRNGMANWTEAPLVPEIAPFVAPAPFPAAPAISTPPPISPAVVEQQPAIPDTSAIDAKIYGNPSGVPVAGLLLSLLFIFFVIVIYFGTYTVEKLYYIGGFYEYPYLMLAGSIVMALVLGISGLVNASAAKKRYFNDEIAKACKKSGAATAFGWAAVLYSLSGIVAGLFTLYFLGEI